MTSRQERSNRQLTRVRTLRDGWSTKRQEVRTESEFERSRFLGTSNGEEVVFDVTLKDANTDIAWVALIRPSSVTHGADMGQRYVELALSEAPDQVGTRMQNVTVQMPINEFYAPPGHYMLVVTDSLHKPSHAVWIQLLDQ